MPTMVVRLCGPMLLTALVLVGCAEGSDDAEVPQETTAAIPTMPQEAFCSELDLVAVAEAADSELDTTLDVSMGEHDGVRYTSPRCELSFASDGDHDGGVHMYYWTMHDLEHRDGARGLRQAVAERIDVLREPGLLDEGLSCDKPARQDADPYPGFVTRCASSAELQLAFRHVGVERWIVECWTFVSPLIDANTRVWADTADHVATAACDAFLSLIDD